MFTGIIEQTGTVKEVVSNGSNKTFWIAAALSAELKVDQSLAHNGVCLTVEELTAGAHRVTAIDETLQKTTLGQWQPGDLLNLERCMLLNGRLDGHIVQGHVDTVVTCTDVVTREGSWEYRFRFDGQFAPLLIEKGSVTLNGTSLTVFNLTDSEFTVAIIPYTYTYTNIHQLKPGSQANAEFDMLGKYVTRFMQFR